MKKYEQKEARKYEEFKQQMLKEINEAKESQGFENDQFIEQDAAEMRLSVQKLKGMTSRMDQRLN